MTYPRLALAAAAAALTMAATAATAPTVGASAPRDTTAARGKTCIDSNRIQSRDPEGSGTILFTMNDGRVYRNRLRTAPCPGLQRLNRFAYLATENFSGSQLCDGDFVRAVDNSVSLGFGLRSAPRCGLGAFVRAPELEKPRRDGRPR